MLQGYDVSNFEQMNEIEREVVQLFAQDVPDTPEVIGIGSSRVLRFARDYLSEPTVLTAWALPARMCAIT